MRLLIVDSSRNPSMIGMDRLMRQWFPGVTTKRVASQDAAEAEIRAGFTPTVILVAGRSLEEDGRTGPMIIEHLRVVYKAQVVEILAAGSLGVHEEALNKLDEVRVVHRLTNPDIDGLKAILSNAFKV